MAKWSDILTDYNKIPFDHEIDRVDPNVELAECMMMDGGLKDLIDADEMIYGFPQYYWKALAAKLKEYNFSRWETERVLDAYAGDLWNAPEGEKKKHLHKGLLDAIFREDDIAEEVQEKTDTKGMTNAEKIAAYIWETADYITQTHDIITFVDSGELRVYESGVYPSKKRELELRKKIADTGLRLFDTRFLTNNITNALDRIKYLTATEREEFDTNKDMLVLRNGVLNLKNMEFLPHDPKHRYTSKVNVQYDPRLDTISEDFEYFLNSTFQGCEQQIDTIQELFGYCLYKEYTFEHFFFLIGGGANGKTTMLNILTSLIGGENVSNLSLHEIVKPRDDHVLCDLYGKMINVCGEIGTGKIYDSRNLKIVTGRDKIRTRQLYQESFSFYNFAKMIFSMNEAPVIEDFTDAFKRRVVVLEFPNQFNKGSEGTRTDIEEKCTSDESLSSILNWAIVGLKRLLKNGTFSNQQSNAVKGLKYDMKSNPIEYFVQDHIVEDIDGYLDKGVVLEEYVKYAKKNNLPILTKHKFNKKFLESCREVGIETKVKQLSSTIDESRAYTYINIGFRNPAESPIISTIKNNAMERDIRTFISNNIELKKYTGVLITDKFLETNRQYEKDDVFNFVMELKRKEWITQ